MSSKARAFSLYIALCRVVVVVVEALSGYVAQAGLTLIGWSGPPSVSPECLGPQSMPATTSSLS